MNKILVGALKECETQAQVEDTFLKFEVSGVVEKTACLNECMGNPETFFLGGSSDDETAYATVLSMFLTAEWRNVYAKC
ncbi:hypothetical protein FACS189494_09480 [Spirochaetia bacterium]|nr:hypothetical protein FACS189494_09480 [Spirochaetia bacterium]